MVNSMMRSIKLSPLTERLAPFIDNIVVSSEGVIKLLKGLNPRDLKELANELGPVFSHLFQQSLDTGEIQKEWLLANICPPFKKKEIMLLLASIALCHWHAYHVSCWTYCLLKYFGSLGWTPIFSDRQHAFRKRHNCKVLAGRLSNE